MSVVEIGARLVELCNQGKSMEAVNELYDSKIASIEGQGSEEMPARIEGIAAVRDKGEWWYANNEVHSLRATGPFCGHRDDQFVVEFEMDLTPKASGERTQLREVGLYTVKKDKIVQEEFLYLMA